MTLKDLWNSFPIGTHFILQDRLPAVKNSSNTAVFYECYTLYYSESVNVETFLTSDQLLDLMVLDYFIPGKEIINNKLCECGQCYVD
jgi:hypothetical protein